MFSGRLIFADCGTFLYKNNVKFIKMDIVMEIIFHRFNLLAKITRENKLVYSICFGEIISQPVINYEYDCSLLL